MAGQVLHFVIVGQDDHPIYEADLSSKASDAKEDGRPQYLYHFVLHAALDAVDEAEWASAAQHLGVVDRFNAFQVSAFTTAGRARLLLLHDGRGDDLVRGFFKDVYELYLRAALNPFFVPSARLVSPTFHQKVKQLARSYFR